RPAAEPRVHAAVAPPSAGLLRSPAPAVLAPRQAGDPTPPCAPGTLTRMFFNTVARMTDRAALVHKESGAYRSISFREYAERVREFGRALLSLGVQPGDRIGLLCENRPEWAITDVAGLCVGAATVSIYTTLTPPQIRYILQDSGARVLVVSNETLLQK